LSGAWPAARVRARDGDLARFDECGFVCYSNREGRRKFRFGVEGLPDFHDWQAFFFPVANLFGLSHSQFQ